MKNHHCLLLPLGLILITIGLVTLIFFGVASLEPYGYSRDFKESRCTVVFSNVTTYHSCEHINPQDEHLIIYSSGHSCLRVKVDYSTDHENISAALLYDKYQTLLHTKDNNITCSIHICREEEDDNEEDVYEFKQEYGQMGQSFKCHYNPENPSEVFAYVPTSSQVVHTILWPSIALGFGLFILVVVIFSSCEVWVCMPWRQKQSQSAAAPHDNKYSYELATVRYGQENHERKTSYRA